MAHAKNAHSDLQCSVWKGGLCRSSGRGQGFHSRGQHPGALKLSSWPGLSSSPLLLRSYGFPHLTHVRDDLLLLCHVPGQSNLSFPCKSLSCVPPFQRRWWSACSAKTTSKQSQNREPALCNSYLTDLFHPIKGKQYDMFFRAWNLNGLCTSLAAFVEWKHTSSNR